MAGNTYNLRLHAVAAVFLVLVAPAVLPGGLLAETLVLFDFNDLADRDDGSTAVSVDRVRGTPRLVLAGGSYTDHDGQSGVGYIDREEVFHPAGRAAAWGSGVNDSPPDNGFTLTIDTSGYRGLTVRFDYRSTKTGPGGVTLTCFVGGRRVAVLGLRALVRGKTFGVIEQDLSSIGAIQGAADVRLQWVWSGDGTGVGTARVDNLEVLGVPTTTDHGR